MNKINLFDIFIDNKPKAIGVVADRNQGKSTMIYNIVSYIKENQNQTSVFQYGLRLDIDGVMTIDSIEKLETVHNCIVFIDEFYSLFDIDNRKKKELIEAVFRLINHNNIVLVLCGLPHNFNKFISSNLNYIIYKQCTIGNFVNGSDVKNIALAYKGVGRGSSMIVMDKNKALFYDVEDKTYYHTEVGYKEEFDTKKNNEPIFKHVPHVEQGSSLGAGVAGVEPRGRGGGVHNLPRPLPLMCVSYTKPVPKNVPKIVQNVFEIMC